MWKISKNRFFYKYDIMVPQPKMSNGTQIVPKMVPKRYPNFLTHFTRRSTFMIFQVQKMATSPLWVPFWVPSQIFGYHRLFFWKTYHVSYLRKKGGSYLAIFTYLSSFLWFFTKSRIFICGTNCIFWVPYNILWYPKILPS